MWRQENELCIEKERQRKLGYDVEVRYSEDLKVVKDASDLNSSYFGEFWI